MSPLQARDLFVVGRPRRASTNAAPPAIVQIDAQKFRDKAAACEQTARHMRDPAAQHICARAAQRWRSTADQSEDRLPYLISLLAPPPVTGG
jgi:hypothetical protein